SRASASAGPPSNRPPHNRVAGPPVGGSPDPICPNLISLPAVSAPVATTLFTRQPPPGSRLKTRLASPSAQPAQATVPRHHQAPPRGSATCKPRYLPSQRPNGTD